MSQTKNENYPRETDKLKRRRERCFKCLSNTFSCCGLIGLPLKKCCCVIPIRLGILLIAILFVVLDGVIVVIYAERTLRTSYIYVNQWKQEPFRENRPQYERGRDYDATPRYARSVKEFTHIFGRIEEGKVAPQPDTTNNAKNMNEKRDEETIKLIGKINEKKTKLRASKTQENVGRYHLLRHRDNRETNITNERKDNTTIKRNEDIRSWGSVKKTEDNEVINTDVLPDEGINFNKAAEYKMDSATRSSLWIIREAAEEDKKMGPKERVMDSDKGQILQRKEPGRIPAVRDEASSTESALADKKKTKVILTMQLQDLIVACCWWLVDWHFLSCVICNNKCCAVIWLVVMIIRLVQLAYHISSIIYTCSWVKRHECMRSIFPNLIAVVITVAIPYSILVCVSWMIT